MTDEEEWTSVQIAGPLPLGVATALTQLIGAAWPEGHLRQSSHYAIDARIPSGKPAEDVDAEFIEQIRKGAESEGADAQFLGFRDGHIAFAPPEELCLELGHVAHAIFTAHEPEAINHVEWSVATGKDLDDPTYVLSISKSRGQTPLAMRKKAEAEVERLRALLEKHGIDPKES